MTEPDYFAAENGGTVRVQATPADTLKLAQDALADLEGRYARLLARNERLVAALEAQRCEHDGDCDRWSEEACSCGAEATNAAIDAALRTP